MQDFLKTGSGSNIDRFRCVEDYFHLLPGDSSLFRAVGPLLGKGAEGARRAAVSLLEHALSYSNQVGLCPFTHQAVLKTVEKRFYSRFQEAKSSPLRTAAGLQVTSSFYSVGHAIAL